MYRYCVLVCAVAWSGMVGADGPFLGNGIKSGEATQSAITIWTRLTAKPDMSSAGVAWPMLSPERGDDGVYVFSEPPLPDGHTLEEMAWSMPGAPGEVRLNYWPEATSNMSTTTQWLPVDPSADFTRQFVLEGLEPGTRYRLVAEARAAGDGAASDRIQGGFTTAPEDDKRVEVTFTVVTGQEFWRRDDEENGHKIYPQMLALNPDFFVHTGDVVYFDKAGPWCVTAAQARHKWHRMYALPFQRAFHNQVTSYFLRDDHDTWQNDCWPTMDNNKMGDFTYAEGAGIFFENVPAPDRERPYRTVRWGKDLQIWLPEGRDFRSPNTDPDGPGKTIWGREQMAWFKKSVEASDATFRVLVSPTPIVGPDRGNKADNHANAAFAHEGEELRAFLAAQENMLVICGDRHWQYASIDPDTRLREFSSGPTSNAHAGGFSEDLREPMHQYLNVIGGFLSCTATRDDGEPFLILRHYDVDGELMYEETLTPESVVPES